MNGHPRRSTHRLVPSRILRCAPAKGNCTNSAAVSQQPAPAAAPTSFLAGTRYTSNRIRYRVMECCTEPSGFNPAAEMPRAVWAAQVRSCPSLSNSTLGNSHRCALTTPGGSLANQEASRALDEERDKPTSRGRHPLPQFRKTVHGTQLSCNARLRDRTLFATGLLGRANEGA